MKIYIRKDTNLLGESEYVVMAEHELIVKCLGIKGTEEEAIECYNTFKEKLTKPSQEIIKEETI